MTILKTNKIEFFDISGGIVIAICLQTINSFLILKVRKNFKQLIIKYEI